MLHESKIWHQEKKNIKKEDFAIWKEVNVTFLFPGRDQVPAQQQEGECYVYGSIQNQIAFTCCELTSAEKRRVPRESSLKGR